MTENSTYKNENADPSINVVRMMDTLVKNFEALVKSSSDLTKAEIRRIDERSLIESARINALRADDVAAVATANERAVKQAETLANQVAMSAEVQRALVATTATTIAAQLAQVTAQLIERIAALEKANYENVGKSGASPDLPTLVADLVNAQNVSKGRSSSFSPIIGMLYAIGGSIITFLILQLIAGKL